MIDPISEEINKARRESFESDKAVIAMLEKLNELLKITNLRIDLMREEISLLKERIKELEG